MRSFGSKFWAPLSPMFQSERRLYKTLYTSQEIWFCFPSQAWKFDKKPGNSDNPKRRTILYFRQTLLRLGSDSHIPIRLWRLGNPMYYSVLKIIIPWRILRIYEENFWGRTKIRQYFPAGDWLTKQWPFFGEKPNKLLMISDQKWRKCWEVCRLTDVPRLSHHILVPPPC